jgi:hypothetical protein
VLRLALRRELSRRVRDDLIRLGVVQPGPAVSIAGGATASAGDLNAIWTAETALACSELPDRRVGRRS